MCRLMYDRCTVAAHRFAYSLGCLINCISTISSVESETAPVDKTVDVEIDVRRVMCIDCSVKFNTSSARVYMRTFDVVLSLVLSARHKGTIITTQYEPIQLPRRGISCNSGLIPTSDAFIDVLDDTDLDM